MKHKTIADEWLQAGAQMARQGKVTSLRDYALNIINVMSLATRNVLERHGITGIQAEQILTEIPKEYTRLLNETKDKQTKS